MGQARGGAVLLDRGVGWIFGGGGGAVANAYLRDYYGFAGPCVEQVVAGALGS